MEDAFRQAFVRQARKRLRIDRAALERLAAEPGSLGRALVRDGLADVAGVRDVYQGVREKLLERNVQHHRDAADRALLRFAVRATVVSKDAAATALARWNERPAYDRPRLADELVLTGAISTEQRTLLTRRLEAEQVACAICGYHVDRLAVEPGMCCPRCGWIELVTTRDSADAAATTWTGRMIGGWTLVERIGQGATGRVFYARHPAHGEGAFKVLNPQAASDPRWLARFEREARAAGGIDHPGVVRILDVGHDEELPYLVMEWVDGESLARRLDRGGPLDMSLAVQIARRLAGALAAAHATGVIHRDIKPANVLLDRELRAKLADFGLARGVVDTTVSQVGAVIGSPGYMSPEQVRGEPLDFRSDVFALGLVVHAMVTGTSPLARSSAMESLRATVNERVPPLSRAVARVPPLLDALVLEMTSRDLARRTPSMARVLDGLERISTGAGVDGATTPVAVATPADSTPVSSGPSLNRCAPSPATRRRSHVAATVRRTGLAASARSALNGPLGLVVLMGLAIVTGLMLRAIWPRTGVVTSPPIGRGPRGGGPVLPPGEPALPQDRLVPPPSVAPTDSEAELVAAAQELTRLWADLIDAAGTPTRVRHARWHQLEATASPTLATLMAARRAQALRVLARQAEAEYEEIGAAIRAAMDRGHWDEARLQADRLPTWSSPLALQQVRWVAMIDERRYAAALAQVVERVRAEPDCARVATTLLTQHPVLAACHAAQEATNPSARWLAELAIVVDACEDYASGLTVPCVVAVERADGTTVELELERVLIVRDASGEPTWGRDLVGSVGGNPAVLAWRDVARTQKARWAIAGMFRLPISASDRRRLVEAYLVAGGVPPSRIAAVLREIDR